MFFTSHETRPSYRFAVGAQRVRRPDCRSRLPLPCRQTGRLVTACLPSMTGRGTEYPANVRRIPDTAEKPLLAYLKFPGTPRKYSAGVGGSPEPVSANRQPFSIRLTASTVSWEILQMCAESRFSQENPQSAAFAAPPVALRSRPAAVDANGHAVPASAAKTPLMRVDSCPFVVHEPMLRKGTFYVAATGAEPTVIIDLDKAPQSRRGHAR